MATSARKFGEFDGSEPWPCACAAADVSDSTPCYRAVAHTDYSRNSYEVARYLRCTSTFRTVVSVIGDRCMCCEPREVYTVVIAYTHG